MANPQPDEFTKVANELLENVPKFRLNGTQLRIIMIIWRYTYGFGRKDHDFSINFLAEAIDSNRTQVNRELKSLIDKRVLLEISNVAGKSRKLRFNKDYDDWDISNCTLISDTILLEETDQSVANPRTPVSLIRDKSVANPRTKKERKKSLKKEVLYMHNSKLIEVIFNQWNSSNLIKHRKLIPHIGHQVNFKLGEGFTLEELLQCISSYSQILNDPDYKLDTKWSLNDFLEKRHFEKFLPDRDPFSFYPRVDGRIKQPTTFDRNKDLLQKKMEEARRRDQRADGEINSFDFDSLPEPPMDG